MLDKIEDALLALKKGEVIIVVDDEDRENEGDFVCAAETITPEIVNFMTTYGRGLLCISLTEERCRELNLDMMVSSLENNALHNTPFTVSVDLLGFGCTTGISSYDRAKTVKALVDTNIKYSDFSKPGHIFPLKARSRGVLERSGHTEAVIDLTRLAGLKEGGALIEILNEDGTMARVPQLLLLKEKYNLKMISIADLIKYRIEHERSIIIKSESVKLPTEFGEFNLVAFRNTESKQEHVALVKGDYTVFDKEDEVLVRVHSSCLTGDVLGSCRCDCGPQLKKAMQIINEKGKGVIVYLNQEGRGIGLFNKIKAYKLQEEGLDTVEANLKLGFSADDREYYDGAMILRLLGISKVNLLTNNPQKKVGLQGYGINIVSNTALEIAPNVHNRKYLETKVKFMGHTLHLK